MSDKLTKYVNSQYLSIKDSFSRSKEKISGKELYENLCMLADKTTSMFKPEYVEKVFWSSLGDGYSYPNTFPESICDYKNNGYTGLVRKAIDELNMDSGLYRSTFGCESLKHLSKKEIFSSFHDLDNFNQELFDTMDISLLKQHTLGITGRLDNFYFSNNFLENCLRDRNVPSFVIPFGIGVMSQFLKFKGMRNIEPEVKKIKSFLKSVNSEINYDSLPGCYAGKLFTYSDKLFRVGIYKKSRFKREGFDEPSLIWGTVLGYYNRETKSFDSLGYKIFNFDDSKKSLDSRETSRLPR